MRLAFLGTPAFAATSLAALANSGFEVVCVYSQPPAPRGRGQTLQPSPVHALADELRIEVRTPVSMRDPQAIADFQALDIDAAVVVAFGQILPAAVLDAPRLGTYNVHGSLLPRWRGAAPVQRAIMAGDPITGVEVMRLTEGLDEGPIIASASLRIDAAETAGTLMDRLAIEGGALLVEALGRLERGEAVEVPQALEGVTYAKKIKPAEARIDWSRPAIEIDRQIRGLAPFPGAWFEAPTEKGPVRIKALLSRVEEGEGAAGTTLDDGLLIACGSGAIRLLRAQREGRAPQDGEEFVRGFPLPAGGAVS